jgi:hypothetical protein
MALRPVVVDKQSPFLGEACAFCKQPFAPGDELAICPDDATRHHTQCWRANGNKCTALGCPGRGEITGGDVPPNPPLPRRESARGGAPRRSKVRTLPSSNYGCGRNCLSLAVAAAVLLFALSCFLLCNLLQYAITGIPPLEFWRELVGLALIPAL